MTVITELSLPTGLFLSSLNFTELTSYIGFSDLNTYQLQSFQVSSHFVSTMPAYVSKNMGTAS